MATATGELRKRFFLIINQSLLSVSKYVPPCWLTMRQANQLRGRPQGRGEHDHGAVEGEGT